MNILEDQVTDLNYLAESPLALTGITGIMNGERQSSSAESPPAPGPSESGNGKKRKGEDPTGNGATQHTRAKRNRYISIAW
jgi:hypothetical protein